MIYLRCKECNENTSISEGKINFMKELKTAPVVVCNTCLTSADLSSEEDKLCIS
jgi:hypothetical protein